MLSPSLFPIGPSVVVTNMKLSSNRALSWLRISLGSLVLAAPLTSFAQDGLDADPEFINPRFGTRAIPGVPTPYTGIRNTVRVGIFSQYERNPVTGYRLGQEVGPIIANRIGAAAGVSWDVIDKIALRAVIPLAYNWGTQVPELYAEGVGLADISVGANAVFLESKFFNMGVYGDVWLPTGRNGAFMGEQSIRGAGGLMTMVKVPFGNSKTGTPLGGLDLVFDAGVVGRQPFETSADYQHGPDLVLSQGLAIEVPWLRINEEVDPIAFTQGLAFRTNLLENSFQAAGETGLEALGGVRIPVPAGPFLSMTVDAMAGRGTTQGFGTTDLRVLGSVTFTRVPGKLEKQEVVDIEVPPPPPPPEEIPVGPPPIAEEVEDEIVIRDPIEFKVNTAQILPVSLPVLQAVAEILNSNATIKHVVIEGHASEEGSYAYNYELSERRAQAVYHQLILDGVALDRMSYRGMGEVRPRVQGDDETMLQANRRVEFHIVSRVAADAEPSEYPTYDERARLPWDGSEIIQVIPETPLTQEERELRRLQEEYQDRKAEEDVFEVDEDVQFEGEEPADAPAAEPEDDFDLDLGGDDDFGFDDETSEPEPVAPVLEEPTPADEPELDMSQPEGLDDANLEAMTLESDDVEETATEAVEDLSSDAEEALETLETETTADEAVEAELNDIAPPGVGN